MANQTNFNALKRPSSPNYYVACPEQRCNIRPDMVSPDYAVSVDVLMQKFTKVMSKEPRMTLLSHNQHHYEYVQKSFLFRFPDFISVEFYSLPNNSSSLSILSRAKYGYYDFGVNKKRVQRLVAHLTSEVSKHVKK